MTRRALPLLLFVMALTGCLQPSEGQVGVPLTAQTASLTDETWTWRMITAAVCNDSRETWAFGPDGTVLRSVSRDHRDYSRDMTSCSKRSSQSDGTYTLAADGTLEVTLGVARYVWQVAVLETMPVPEVAGGYRVVGPVLSSRAFAADATRPQTYQRRWERYSSGEYTYASQELTTLRFAAPLATGDCRVDASVATVEDGAERVEDGDDWSFDCAITPTGVEDWMSVSYLGPAYDGQRWVRIELSRSDRPILYYRSSRPSVMVGPYYEPIWDSGWMEAVDD